MRDDKVPPSISRWRCFISRNRGFSLFSLGIPDLKLTFLECTNSEGKIHSSSKSKWLERKVMFVHNSVGTIQLLAGNSSRIRRSCETFYNLLNGLNMTTPIDNRDQTNMLSRLFWYEIPESNKTVTRRNGGTCTKWNNETKHKHEEWSYCCLLVCILMIRIRELFTYGPLFGTSLKLGFFWGFLLIIERLAPPLMKYFL